MSLYPYALTTVARAKAFLGITGVAQDTIIEQLINAFTNMAESYCDRRFLETIYTNEVYDGTGISTLLLKNYPVITFTSLEMRNSTENVNSWSAIPSSQYFANTRTGIVTLTGGSIFLKLPQMYRATYTAGYQYDLDTPTYLGDAGAYDLEYACWKSVGTMLNNKNANMNVQSESIGDYSVTFRAQLEADDEVEAILHGYRRPPRFA